jgi:hypothetical protein
MKPPAPQTTIRSDLLIRLVIGVSEVSLEHCDTRILGTNMVYTEILTVTETFFQNLLDFSMLCMRGK